MERLGSKIAKLRSEKGISKAVVARACGITQTAYANIENDNTKSVTIEIGKGIANAIGIHFNELFEIDLPKENSGLIEKLEEEKKELLDKIKEKEKIIFLSDQVVQNFKFAALESVFSANYYASQFLKINGLNKDQTNDIETLFGKFSNHLKNIFFSRGCLSELDIEKYNLIDSLKDYIIFTRPLEEISELINAINVNKKHESFDKLLSKSQETSKWDIIE